MAGPAASDPPRSGFSAPKGRRADQLQRLARATTELGAARTMADVVEAAVEHAAKALGAAVVTLMLREDDRLLLIGSHGLHREAADQWRSFSIHDDTPASEAVRTRRPVLLGADVLQQYPDLRGSSPHGRSVVCLPLGAEIAVGVIGLTFEREWLPGPTEFDFMITFAEACGQAVRRVRASAEAAEKARQLQFLANASTELASSLDYHTTLTKVARLVVPHLADWCSVEIVDHDRVQTVAVEHVDPAKVEWVWEFRRRYPVDPTAPHGVGRTIRTGTSELISRVDDDLLVAIARDEEHLRIAREIGLRSAMVVPIIAGGRILGAINLSRADDPRPYTEADLAVAEDLGRRAGMAIENAQLHRQTLDTAEQLQRAVLPAALDHLPAWEVATYYDPGGRAGVGGDFYGATVLPDGRLAAFIGDVMGHGIAAAAAMAQLRAAVRAFLTMDPTPTTVVGRLRHMFQQLDVTRLATLGYVLIDPARERVEVVTAGHYPPLLVRAAGGAQWCEGSPQPVLGIGADDTAPAACRFAAGDTLLMFTDGLVERRDEIIDAGLARALSCAEELRARPLQPALDRFVRRVRGADGDDDVAAIAVRAR